MILRALSTGSVTGTSSYTVASGVVGGLLITADGTNDATVLVKRTDTNGKAVISIVTKTPMWVAGPFSLENVTTAFLSVSGTGAAAQIYEWVD